MGFMEKRKQERLDKISEFIAHITLNGATEDEIRRATEYSKALIDHYKAIDDVFNTYHKVVEETKIYELMRKYKKHKIYELMRKYKKQKEEQE